MPGLPCGLGSPGQPLPAGAPCWSEGGWASSGLCAGAAWISCLEASMKKRVENPVTGRRVIAEERKSLCLIQALYLRFALGPTG